MSDLWIIIIVFTGFGIVMITALYFLIRREYRMIFKKDKLYNYRNNQE